MLSDLVSGGASCADPTADDGSGTNAQSNPIARLASTLLGPKAGPSTKPPGARGRILLRSEKASVVPIFAVKIDRD